MPRPGACCTHSTLRPTSTREEAATCPASLTTQTLDGAVNNPVGNLPSPKCLTEAGCPHKGGPTHGREEAGKGQGHCTSDSHINSMLLRPALSTTTRQQDQGPSTHSSRATAVLPLHPLLLMAGVLNQKLLPAFLLSPCYDFGHVSCWQQQNNPQTNGGGETPHSDGASQNPEQTSSHLTNRQWKDQVFP